MRPILSYNLRATEPLDLLIPDSTLILLNKLSSHAEFRADAARYVVQSPSGTTICQGANSAGSGDVSGCQVSLDRGEEVNLILQVNGGANCGAYDSQDATYTWQPLIVLE
jgi:hypothetical protein